MVKHSLDYLIKKHGIEDLRVKRRMKKLGINQKPFIEIELTADYWKDL